MSDLEKDPAELVCPAGTADGPVVELLEARQVVLGRTTKVRRLLPNKNRRMVGAWCFVDHYGPDDLTERVDSYDVPGERGMLVPPHPHTSLQTVSWLFEGEIEHRDSVGSHAMVRPGELNIMTAGNGIAHSEISLPTAPPMLHGAQLWVALPDSVRTTTAPAFNAYADLPKLEWTARSDRDGRDGRGSHVARTGVHAARRRRPPDRTRPDRDAPTDDAFEYAVLVVDGSLQVGELTPGFGEMVYLGTGRSQIDADGPRWCPLPAAGRRTVRGGARHVVELHRPHP